MIKQLSKVWKEKKRKINETVERNAREREQSEKALKESSGLTQFFLLAQFWPTSALCGPLSIYMAKQPQTVNVCGRLLLISGARFSTFSGIEHNKI